MRTIILAALLLPSAAFAQSNPTTVTPVQFNGLYSQSFDGLASSGSTGTALPEGFQVIEGGTNANGSYAVGTGSSNAGGSYSFGAAGSAERALGSLGSGTLSPIYFGGVLTNALGTAISGLSFAYTGEQWRLGNSVDDGLTFQYRLGATDLSGTTGWTTFVGLNFAPLFTNGTSTGAALNGNDPANQRAIAATITGLTLGAGQTFGFRWVDTDSTGADQGLGVDSLRISAAADTTPAVPEPATWAIMLLGFGAMGQVMRRHGAGGARIRFA